MGSRHFEHILTPLYSSSGHSLPFFVAAFAVAQTETATSPYLDFGEFKTVVDADKVDALDKLKWAGMQFVNAPWVHAGIVRRE